MNPQTLVLESGERVVTMHLSTRVQIDDLERMATTIEERVACLPNARDLSAKDREAPVMRTTDPRIVNCPLCKTTNAYKVLMEELRVPRARSARLA